MPTRIALRPATYADVDAVAGLHVDGWRTAYAPALDPAWLASEVEVDRGRVWRNRLSQASPDQRVLVAQDGDTVVGFGCVFLDADDRWGAFLDNLHVASGHRGNGVGTQLLHALARMCNEGERDVGLHLWVLRVNTRGQEFYERLGARRCGAFTWNAPEGSQVPVWRYCWPAGALPRD